MKRFQLKKRVCVWICAWMLAASLVLLLSGVPIFSQGGTGALNGTVTSMAGGPVAGATVSIVDIARGVTYPVTTDPAGLYSLSGLTPGAYTVRVEAMGFKTMEHTGIALITGTTLTVDFIMQPGAASEVVTITAEVLPANAAAVVENRAVNETPVNGRTISALTENRASGQSTLPGGAPNAQTANGMRTDQNNPLIDGIYEGSINTGWSEWEGQFQATPDPDMLIPLDAISEINNTNMPSASYGWHVGNTQNLGVKAGTNTLHGTAYAFGRDADLDARNPFNGPAGERVPGITDGKTGLSFEQWGASVGGKIKKDKLFYFLNYERIRYNVGATALISSWTDYDLANGVGTAASASNNAANSVPDAIYTLLQKNITPNQLQMNVAGCGGLVATSLSASTPLSQIDAGCAKGAYVAPNGTSSFGAGYAAPLNLFNNYGASGQVGFGVPTIGGPDTGIVKVDYHLNNKNSFNAEFMAGNGESNAWTKVSVQPWWEVDTDMRDYTTRAVWVYTPNSSLVNEARFGMNYFNGNALPSDCEGLNGAPSYIGVWGFNSGGYLPCQIPWTTISGETGLLWSGGGKGPYTTDTREWIGADNASWTHGKHVIKFGVEIRRGTFVDQSGGGGNGPPISGTLSYGSIPAFSNANTLEDYLTGNNGAATIYTGSPTGNVQNIRANYYAGFIDDTIRLTRTLAIELGLRYEFQPPYSQDNNLEGTFSLANLSGLGQEQTGVPLWHDDTWRHNFGPRAALSWDVTGTGKTVVRVNGGIMYAMTTYSGLSGMQNMPNGATFISPQPPGTGGACGSYSNGVTSMSTTAGTGLLSGLCTFTNPAGQNGITQGTISQSTPLNYNVCNPALTAYGSASALTCSPTQTVYGALVGKGLLCGDGLPITATSLTGLPSAEVPLNPPPCSIQYTSPNLYNPYITKWQVSLQQALGRHFSFFATYNGNHGTGIRELLDLNQPNPGPKNVAFTSSNGSVYTANAEQDRRPYTTDCSNGTVPGVVTGFTSGPCLPWLSSVFTVANSGLSNYDAGVFTLSVRALHGITGNINYTLQHCLDLFSMNENIWTYLADTADPQRFYGTCTTSTAQRLTGNINWAIPGRRSPLQLLQGWAVNATMTLLPNRYAVMNDTTDDLAGVGNGPTSNSTGDAWDMFGSAHNFKTFGLTSVTSPGSTIPCFGVSSGFTGAGCTGSNGNETVTLNGNTYTVPSLGPGGVCTADAALLGSGSGPGYGNSPSTVSGAPATVSGYSLPQNTAMYNLVQYGCYVEGGSVMLPPAQGVFGNMARNCCLGPGFFEIDASVTKEWGFMKEQRLKVQFRAEAFNILNYVNYTSPTVNLGSPKGFGSTSSTPNTSDEVVIGVGGPREVQLGLKLIW